MSAWESDTLAMVVILRTELIQSEPESKSFSDSSSDQSGIHQETTEKGNHGEIHVQTIMHQSLKFSWKGLQFVTGFFGNGINT